jgi:hypothetical protein
MKVLSNGDLKPKGFWLQSYKESIRCELPVSDSSNFVMGIEHIGAPGTAASTIKSNRIYMQ